MKILLVHKFYRMTGGTEVYFRDLASILEAHGHETIPFAIKHPDNDPTPYEKYFLSDLDYKNNSAFYRLSNFWKIITRTLYSLEAKRSIERLINDTRPDIVHFQSIEHHISPSILHTFRKYNLPVVQSVNTYKHVCASYRLFLMQKGEICERCLYGKHYHAVLTRCVKGSLSASALAATEMYLHQAMKIYHLVDRFIVANQFMQNKLLGAGFHPNKIARLNNPLMLSAYKPSYELGDYILYFGRIDAEKGVTTLIQAMQKLPKLKLVVIGDGSVAEEAAGWVKDREIQNVEFVGPKWGSDMLSFLARARLVVVPSIWHEPSPMVIYQSLATGKPVIGARIGGIPDLLPENTGLLFTPGNVDDLAEKISSIAFDDERLRFMGRAARAWAEQAFDPEGWYDSLMEIYTQTLEAKKK